MNDFNFKAFHRQRETQVEFQENSSVPATVITTVLSFTNTGGKLFIEGIGGEGNFRAEWFVYINNVLIVKRRSSTADPSIDIPMYDTLLVNSDILDVKVRHVSQGLQEFSSDVRYFR